MQKYGISTTSTTDAMPPSKLEAEARKPSGWEFFPFMWAGSITLGLLLSAWLGIRDNVRDVLPYLVNGFFLGAGIPVVAVVVFASSMVAYGLARNAIWYVERWKKIDIDGDGNVGRSPVVALNPYQGRNALAADQHAAQMSQWQAFVRGCETHTTWASWRDTINRETWQDWRDELMASGWAVRENPNQANSAWVLTAPASEILAALHHDKGL